MELHQRSKDCEFGASENDMIRDKIVLSLNDQRLKDRLLRESDLTLERTVDICRAAKTARAQIHAMTRPIQDRVIHDVSKIKDRDYEQLNNRKKKLTQSDTKTKNMMCKKCGKIHQPKQCPAYGLTCRKCGKLNHNAKMCESTKATQKKTLHDLSKERDTLFIGTVEEDVIRYRNDTSWYAHIKTGCMTVKFKLDTGAETNILPQTV